MSASLILISVALCAMLLVLWVFCLRERRKTLAHEVLHAADPEHDQAEDFRVSLVLFGAIIVAALLGLFSMYVIFYSRWT